MSWFRYAMEAADDGAGGGGEDVAVDETPAHVSAFENPDLWDTPEPSADEGEGSPADAPGAAPQAEDTQPEVAAKPDGWSDDDWGAFQKKYPGGSPADLWKHYSNLQAEFSRVKNGVPTPATEEPEEPEFEEPASWRAHNFDALGAIPTTGLSHVQATQLSELMAIDPEAAAHWSIANSHVLKEDEFKAIQNTWAQADPHGYHSFWREQEELRRQAALEEQYGPTVSAVTQAKQLEGSQMAQETIPAIQEHLEPFKEWLIANPTIDEHLVTLTEPEHVKNALIAAFMQFYGPYRMTMDAEQQAEAAAAEAAAQAEAEAAAAEGEKANRRARTATRTAPAAPDGAAASPDDIKAAIRAAGAGR